MRMLCCTCFVFRKQITAMSWVMQRALGFVQTVYLNSSHKCGRFVHRLAVCDFERQCRFVYYDDVLYVRRCGHFAFSSYHAAFV